MTLQSGDFQELLKWNGQIITVSDGRVSKDPFASTPHDQKKVGVDSIQCCTVQLSEFDKAALSGTYGEAISASMKIIVRYAQMLGAHELMDISQAHVDSAWYGPGSLALGFKLRDWGGRFRVPTTLNSSSVDHRRWKALGIDTELGAQSDKLSKAFLDMGGTLSFTCTPYLLDGAPQFGDNVAWGESNAVIFANSVLGARTLKNPNILECLIALTGRAPKAGVYLDSNRRPSVWIKVQQMDNIDDSFWPILGYTVGGIVGSRIPVITGLEDCTPCRDNLKAFSAAFATSSGAPMFHMVNITPEARTIQDIWPNVADLTGHTLDMTQLRACWDEFNYELAPQKVDIISLGNPHFSFREIKELALRCRGRVKHSDVAIIITCSRAQYGLAAQAGYITELEQFGAQFLTDTCWCSIQEPIIPKLAQVIMTNSGKYIHYGPGLTGRNFVFGSLSMCVEAACLGLSTGNPPPWLDNTGSKNL